MFGWLDKIDNKIIETLQALYLWIFDWTGIYVATAATICVIFARAIIGFSTDIGSLLILAFNIVVLIPAYNMQDKKLYTVYNAQALMLRGFSMRWIVTVFISLLLVQEIIVGDVWQALNSLALLVYVYLTVICIRDREPKEWFAQHKLAWNKS